MIGIRGSPPPFLPHVLAGPNVIHPLSYKHDVDSDLLTLVSSLCHRYVIRLIFISAGEDAHFYKW